MKLVTPLRALMLFGLLFPLMGQSAEVTHLRAGLDLPIPDQGYYRYVISDLSPLVVEKMAVKVRIEHSRVSDLMIMMISPQGKYAMLPLTPSTDDDSWWVDLSTANGLEEFVGENAFGNWELQIYDQVKGNAGVLQSVELKITGNRPLAQDPSQAPTVMGASCSEKWSNLLAGQEYKDEYRQLTFQCDQELKSALFQLVKGQRALTYEGARKVMFSSLDNVDGKVCSVYSEKCIKTHEIPSNSVMNCEHSWPQSKGAVGDAQSDLHHLFPAMSKENSDRNNFPFCEVIQDRDPVLGTLGTSASGTQCYEPPDRHKGDVARAMFYFAVRYQKQIDPEQEATFRKWNMQDPVSVGELQRNQSITSIQGKSNPFIDHPEFAELIVNF